MPGIVGLLTTIPRDRAEPELRRMVDAVCHESFYRRGTWIDESLGVYVGWVARENSFCDAMPLRNETEDITLVFSGEDFPDPGTPRRLKERGHAVAPRGPSYLVHLCEEDADFPAGWNGRFHGLLTDRTRGTAVLFNDRYGMHRLYYHESPHAFYFAAEAKAILAVRPELRRLDPRALGEFVACGCVLENRTLFPDIHVLPGGSMWMIRAGLVEKKPTYFAPHEWEDQAPLDPESSYREIRDVFSRNLPRYFEGGQRIGMSLTGGLDTRMIMAWRHAPPGSLPCYTFGGVDRDCQDVLVAREVARACHQPHQVIPADGFLAHFSHYAERTVLLSDGCLSVANSPDLYLNERAREIAPVRMTGNYGGEVLRRVRAFKPEEPVRELFRPEFLAHIGQARETYRGLLRAHPLSFAVFKQAPWHHHALLALEETQLALRSPYLDNDLVQAVFRAPESVVADAGVCRRLIAAGDEDLARIRTDRGIGGARGRLVELAARSLHQSLFKAEYAYDYGMPQWLAAIDHRLARLQLERLFLGRHKFHHFRVWYRDVLSDYVREMLLDPRTLSRPYFERRGLQAVVRGHLEGRRNYTTEIHKALTIELVYRLFLDPQ